MGHLVGIAQLLHGSCAVAAADDGDGISLAQSLGHSLGALGESGKLKHAHGAVPDHSAGVLHSGAVQLHRLGTDIQTFPAVGDAAGFHGLHIGVRSELVAADGIHGQQQLHALGSGLCHHFVGVVLPVGLKQGVADLAALGSGEGIGHTATDDDGVGDLQQVVDNADLGADLGAAQNGHQGTLGVGQSAANEIQFLLDQEAGNGRQIIGHTSGGGVGAMHGAESVGHINLGHIGHSLGQLGIVLGFTLLKTGVLQQQHLTGLQSGGLGLGILAHHVGSHDDFAAQQFAQTLGNGSQRQLGQRLAPLLLGDGGRILALFGLLLDIGVKGGHGLAHVGAGDDGGTLTQQVLDGGQSGTDALIVGDDTAAILGHGNVEIAAQQHFLAGHIYVHNSLLIVVHGTLSLLTYGNAFIQLRPFLRCRSGRESRSGAAPRR